MKILFYHPFVPQRKHEISYDCLQDKSGFSGTETALIEISHSLVQKGHTVFICGMTRQSSIDTDGVRYITVADAPHTVNMGELDYFCPIFYTTGHEHDHLLRMCNRDRTIVWVWMQCFIDANSIRTKYIHNGYRVCASFLSPYMEKAYALDMFHSWVTIGNAVGNMFCIDETIAQNQNRTGNWMYHATYERGGPVASRVFNYVSQRIPSAAKELHYASYYTDDVHKFQNQQALVWHGSISKKEVATFLTQSDYFVYPLVLHYGSVHHDTFGSVMLEALACGAIVVTWNVACIPSVYSDYVLALTPKCDAGYDPQAPFGYNHWMNSEEAVAMMAEKIIELEQNPDKKEAIRQRGMQWAQTQTWESKSKDYEAWLSANLTKP